MFLALCCAQGCSRRRLWDLASPLGPMWRLWLGCQRSRRLWGCCVELSILHTHSEQHVWNQMHFWWIVDLEGCLLMWHYFNISVKIDFSIRPLHNPCVTVKLDQRQYHETRGLFSPLSGRHLFLRWQTLQVSFAEWLTDWLIFEVWEWHSEASQEKTMLESCYLRCKQWRLLCHKCMCGACKTCGPISQNAAR